MNEACARLTRIGKDGVIMTTDADTTVAPNWIEANIREIELGADAVGGRILMTQADLDSMGGKVRDLHVADDKYRLLVAEIEDLIDELPFDNGARHHQHFNASFAITAEAYLRSGGVPNVECLEDCALFDILERLDMRVRHSFDVEVYTSARSVGRARYGLSNQINEWERLAHTGQPSQCRERRVSC